MRAIVQKALMLNGYGEIVGGWTDSYSVLYDLRQYQ